MSFDPKKLTPAPWMVTPPGHDAYPAVITASGFPVLLSESDNVDDVVFAAVARNLLDVGSMEHRLAVEAARASEREKWATVALAIARERWPDNSFAQAVLRSFADQLLGNDTESIE